MTNEEKALHFAEIGLVDYANLYAVLALIDEIKDLKRIKVDVIL